MAQPTYPIDLTEVLLAIIAIGFPIIGFFASLAFNALADKFKMQANSERRSVVETAIANGIAKAEALAVDYAKHNGRMMTRSERIAVVANHVATTAVTAQKALKIGPDELLESIKARLPEAKAAVEAAQQGASVLECPPPAKPERPPS